MSMVRRKLCRARKASGAGWVMISSRNGCHSAKSGYPRQRQAQPIRRVDERRAGLPRSVEPVVALGRRRGGAVELGGADPEPRHHRLAMRRREAGDVLRHPQPEPLHLDSLALIDDIVVDAGAASLGEEGAQAGVPRRGGGEGRRRSGRRARHADPPIAPVLSGDPVERVVPVIGVVGVDPVLALGTVAATAVLVNRRVATIDDGFPAAQDRAAHRLGRIGQPGARMVKFVRRVGGGDAVWRAMEDHRPARPSLFGQERRTY